MKTRIASQNKQRGIVLVTTLATILILAIIVASYLTLANNQSTSVERSQSWNQAIPVLESGIEESLTQLHYAGTNGTLLLSNSWTYGADGLYHKTRTFSDGSYFNATIQATNLPVIVSTGFVPVMYRSSSTNTSYVSRRVRVVTQPQPVIPGGLNSVGTITLNGGATLDSFNSANPSFSTGGLYASSKHEANARALTDSGAAGAVSVGTGNISGSAVTGPTGTVTVGGIGAVGDLAWVASSSGIEAGHTANDANVQFNDVAAPFTYGTGVTPTGGPYSVGGTNYAYKLIGGNYNIASMTLNGGSAMLISGNTTLYVNGDFTVVGNSYIYIAPGGSLNLYINGTASISGGGVINGSQTASQCTIFGMSGCTSFTYSGGAAYVGTVYAPDADFTFSGGAGASGAFTGNTIKVTGGAAIHFDEALLNSGNGYVVMSWNEF